mmetsp:Transcript_11409/g.17253  ORF Transcript_11409/g.17253 Transcript_11409/m.17253 type:complete len:230 (-) Transcript_11409:202-891(-)
MSALTSQSFKKLVTKLKQSSKTCTAIEQCCGGTISTSIMAQPGSSSVYYGGSIIYNTKKAKSLFLNDETLHASLANVPSAQTKEEYIQSKIDWTAKTSVEFCKALGTDYAISEGGAAGPTFRFDDMENGFAVLSVAGRRQKQQQLEEEVNNSNSNSDEVRVLKQTVVHSPHADREKNMRFFADAAADLLAEVIHTNEEQEKEEEEEDEEEEEEEKKTKIQAAEKLILCI